MTKKVEAKKDGKAEVVEIKNDRPELKPHVVIRKFEQIVGDVMIKMPMGKVITDFNLIQKLLDARAPIVELGKEQNFCVCPSCSHIFASEKNGSAAA